VTVERLLRLNVGRIGAQHERVDRRFEPSVLPQQGDVYRIVEPVELTLDVYKDLGLGVDKADDRFRVTGDVRSTLELSCSRCLEPFTMPVHTSFDLRYVPQTANAGVGELEVGEDDLTTAYYEGESIDLEQLIREQLYLAVPMKPLCDEACKGLCPTCGNNLNAGPCDCKSEWVDPRLEALKGLLDRES
jgi:uncharacterized protein